jgi:hypothetical protein
MKIIERTLLEKKLDIDRSAKLSAIELKEKINLLKDIFPTFKERLKSYYSDHFFKDITQKYISTVYPVKEFQYIEFAFSPLTFETFTNSVIGVWKEKKQKYELKKPAITQRAIFFDNIDDLYQYCITKLPFAIYIGGIYSSTDKIALQKTMGSRRTPVYRPVVFDFDNKKDWRNTISWTLIMCYYLSRIFDITEFFMFFSGMNGIHLYPRARTKLLMLAETNKVVRENFTNIISNINSYFFVIPEQFLIAKNILQINHDLKRSIKYYKYSRSVEYEIYLSDSELQEVIENPKGMIKNIEKIEEELKQYIPIFDIVVTKDLSRIIRLPGSVHPITFQTCDPFYINNEKMFTIETRE